MRKSHVLLLILKVFYCFYGVFIFGKLTFLGDSGSYLSSSMELSLTTLKDNTLLIKFTTALLKKVLVIDFFVHLAYCLFSFWGLVLVLKELKLSLYKEYILVFFLCMPSFGMWASVVSKEAFSVFFSCIALVWIINLFERKPMRFSLWINLISLYLVIIMRPTVGVGLSLLIVSLYFANLKYLNKYLKFFTILITVIVSSLVVYQLTSSFIKDEFLPLAEAYFDPRSFESKSTREFGFWKSASDLFVKAPYGILIASLGPNLPESVNKPYFAPYFLEGLVFLTTMFYLISAVAFKQLRRRVISVNFFLFLTFGVGLILFLNYPFGLFNPGSATRYRSSYYHIIVIGLFYFYYKEKLNYMAKSAPAHK